PRQERPDRQAAPHMPRDVDALFAEVTRQRPGWDGITARFDDPVAFTVRERDSWPKFAAAQLWLDPETGSLVRQESYATSDAGRRVRAWLRFLHTGEALGWEGQLVAAGAALGGAFLVWTGLAMAVRRLRRMATRSPP